MHQNLTIVYTPTGMSLLRARTAVVSTLLIAAVAMTAFAATSHGHSTLALDGAHSDWPSFAADHDHPVAVPHIEDATRVEAAGCIGCLVRQRQRAASSQDPGLIDIEPEDRSLGSDVSSPTVAESFRLLPSRAPPRA